MYEAVLWDFGGVILTSPFEAFSRYEIERGLPPDFLRTVNATEPHTNAWARLERSDITAADFDTAFASDALALGHHVNGAEVLALLAGDVRPEMVEALDRVKAAGYRTACLTNNMSGEHASSERRETALGMHTIKVVSATQALNDLEAALGIPLRCPH